MNTESIRTRVAAVFMTQGRILVHSVLNKDDGMIWHVPPGGGVEKGESIDQALKREIKEELDFYISSEQFIGSFESQHSINGMKEHEVSMVFSAAFSTIKLNRLEEIEVTETNGMKKVFRWVPLERLMESDSILYPIGLLDKIRANQSSHTTPASAPR